MLFGVNGVELWDSAEGGFIDCIISSHRDFRSWYPIFS
jgi:hypothetical protein